MTNTLLLYTTSGCHLCEEAETLLQQLILAGHTMEVIPVDISIDEKLVELYGIRIPVVKNPASEMEIAWPFNAQQLLGLLN